MRGAILYGPRSLDGSQPEKQFNGLAAEETPAQVPTMLPGYSSPQLRLGPVWRKGSCLLIWDGPFTVSEGSQAAMICGLSDSLQKHGFRYLEELEGPFRLFWLDLSSRDWILARGPHGLRPVFWSQTPEGVFFSRDIPTLLDVLGSVPGPNWTSITEYLLFQHVAGGPTLLENVQELLPGEVIRGNLDSRAILRDTFPLFPRACKPSSSDLGDLLLEVLKASVMEEDPEAVGIFLSGGVDSALMAWAWAELGWSARKAFTVTCPGYLHDEAPFARFVADRLGLSWEQIPLDPSSFSQSWASALESIGLPMTSTNQVVWWLLCQRASLAGVTGALAGEGADGWISGGLNDQEVEALRGAKGRPDEQAGIAILCKSHRLNDPALLERIMEVPLDLTQRKRLWEQSLADTPGVSPEEQAVVYHVRTAGQRLLSRADYVAQVFGMAIKLPFLHRFFLSWVRANPWEIRNHEGVRKSPLKALCASIWGEPLAYRRKVGFPFPLRTWIRDSEDRLLRSFREMLLSPETLRRPIYRGRILEKELRDRMQKGKAPLDWLMWSLINLELWLRWLKDRRRAMRHGEPPLAQGGSCYGAPEAAG